MNATPLLARILAALHEQRLEAVLIGNAAAAIHGAPVTTVDFDFMFRSTPTNLRKLKAVAKSLDAMILRPYYPVSKPVSKLYRVVNDAAGLQADFMHAIHGIRSFEGLRSRAVTREIAGRTILVASLDDIIASKKAAGRDSDLAVLPSLEKNPHVCGKGPIEEVGSRMPRERKSARKPGQSRAAQLAALKAESERQLEDLIRRRLAMPIEQRMNFLRKRLPGGGSCL
jgi:hypothetical protein